MRTADKKVRVQKFGFRSYRVFGNTLGRTYLTAVNDSTGDADAFLDVSVKPTWFRKHFREFLDVGEGCSIIPAFAGSGRVMSFSKRRHLSIGGRV